MPGYRDPTSAGRYVPALRESGLLGEGGVDGYYRRWLENAARRGVRPRCIVETARRHRITPRSFAVLEEMTEVKDPGGQSFFLIPPGISGGDVRHAVLMTYALNAGTGYRSAPGSRDFTETPYSAVELQRIRGRQRANGWSYPGVRAVVKAGGSVATTPNGMLMAVGGNRIQCRLGRRGGTAYGDIFLVGISRSVDPIQQLRQIIASGRAWGSYQGTTVENKDLDLNRLLHHEERHAQQWARLGPIAFPHAYLAAEAWARLSGRANRFERDAGLRDGGYA